MLMMSFLLFLLAKNNIRIISKSTAVPEYRIIEVTTFWIIKYLIQIYFWIYSNIKLCRCQLKNHQNIDKKLVCQILKSPAIEMIAGLNFNIQMIYLSKKVEKKVEFELKYSAIYRIWQKEKTLKISVFLMYWFVVNPYFTSVRVKYLTCNPCHIKEYRLFK